MNPARKIGAHGGTRTCILLIRNQVLSPIELRVRCWRRDGDLNSDCSVENRVSYQLDDRGEYWLPDQDSNLDWPVNNRVSCHWTIGEDLVEHLGLEPSSISLQGRSADPARAPNWARLGGQTL